MRFTRPRDPDLDQRAEHFAEPSRDDIVRFSRAHTSTLQHTDEDAIWGVAGMQHCVVATVGRRSGKGHSVTLPFWLDVDGHRIVVASFAGAERHPAWFLNLSDRTANPTVRVRVQGGEFAARADVLEGAERDAIWAELVVDRPWYADYQSRTERRIPLVRLVETG